jgi:hypothetical protein
MTGIASLVGIHLRMEQVFLANEVGAANIGIDLHPLWLCV